MANTTSITDTRPDWSTRADRAIPRIEVPRLGSLDASVTADLAGVRLVLLVRPLFGVIALVGSVAAGWWPLVPVALWFHYGSTATAVHHLIHGSLGLSSRARRRWLTALGLLILESGHAWQTTHLLHHRDGSDLPDPEGYVEYLSWRRLPLGACLWRYRIAAWGWRHSPHGRRTTAEITTVLVVSAAAVAVVPITNVALLLVAALHLGTFLFAVLLAKGPHTNFGRPVASPLVAVHTRVLGILLFNHHLHLEHHAYPKVPMARLHHVRPVVQEALADEYVHHVHLAA